MENNLFDYLSPLVKKYWLVLFLALSALIFFGYGMISFIDSSQNFSQVNFDTNLHSAKVTPYINLFALDIDLFALDIEGQVRSPGIYKLKQNSIVQDALIVSGGLNGQVDRDWVAKKNLNLALIITDGQKIYIPRVGETTAQASTFG